MGARHSPAEASRIEYKWTVLTVTTVGVLMAGIDSRIVIVGLPQVASSLGADAEQAIWITQAYVLGSTVALSSSGGSRTSWAASSCTRADSPCSRSAPS